MQIRVTCPRCERTYNLDEDMVGLKIMCPNRMCGDVFVVQPAPSEAPPPLPEAAGLMPIPGETGAPQSGRVGDMVPVLPTEAVSASPETGPSVREQSAEFTAELDNESRARTADWRREPPRPPAGKPPSDDSADRRSTRTRRAKKRDTVQLSPGTSFEVLPVSAEIPAAPKEVPPGVWEPPPVRGGPDGQSEAPVAPADDELDQHISATARRRRRRRLALAGVLVGAIAVAIATLVTFLPGLLGKSEEERAAAAYELYAKEQFADASAQFRELAKVQDSDHHDDYEFMADLSDVRQRLPNVNPDLSGAGDVLRRLVVGHESDARVIDHGKDLWGALRVMIDGYTRMAQAALTAGKPNLVQVKQDLDAAKQWVAIAGKLRQGVAGSELRALTDSIHARDEEVARAEKRLRDLASADGYPATPDGLKRLRAFVQDNNYGQDDDFQAVIRAHEQAVLQTVTYTPVKRPPATHLLADDPGLIVGVAAAGTHRRGDPVVFAVSRGVLYALHAADLSLLWFTRVGHDNTHLPVSLERDPLGRQAVLVISSDSDNNTLTARDMDSGKIRWSQTLGPQPGLAVPLVVNRLAYVPTVEGIVHVVDTDGGAEVGQYQLGGLPLKTKGVWQPGVNPGTDLVYFAADRENVYALDVNAHKCVGILSTNHGPDTLEADPVILSRASARKELGKTQQELPDYLVLTVKGEDGSTHERAFRLPIEPGSASEESPTQGIAGIGSFTPYSDPEKLVEITDAGQLAVFGIGQPGNSDPPLFVESTNDVVPRDAPRRTGGAQVVYTQENDFWVLANGTFQRWHFDIFSQKLTAMWDAPLVLGAPLHAARVNAGSGVAYLVTQVPNQDTCEVTAVSLADGKIVSGSGQTGPLQRQIGFMSQGEPLALGNVVVALDKGGSLFALDPAVSTGRSSQTIGKVLGSPVLVGDAPSYLLPAADGRSVYQITAMQGSDKAGGPSNSLLVRHFTPGQAVIETRLDLGRSLPRGTLGVESNSILVPLDNGELHRFSLADGTNFPGPNVVHSGQTSYVLSLADGDLLVSDGGSELKRYHWPTNGNDFQPVNDQGIRMPARIVAAPLLLPADPKQPGFRVLVADADQNVLLFEGTALQKKRQWKLPGAHITAGPYLSGGRVGCVVDKNVLVWLDPDHDRVQQYSSEKDEIVGRPQIADGLFVVADTGGKFVGVDPASGKALDGGGYTLQANAPTAAPVPFGAGHVMAPLGDGTVFVLALEKLRKK